MALPAVIIIMAGCEKPSIATYYPLHAEETIDLNPKKIPVKNGRASKDLASNYHRALVLELSY